MNRPHTISTPTDTSSRQPHPALTALFAALVLVGGYLALSAVCRLIIALGWYVS
ncbi:hypothetical protein [Rhodococcus sp. 05-2255-1e]|uniref:hypothetical protein n=1 Tax=Rhodococcus sp. 05-2255-1e TaxID=2022495 RepID=UPI0015C6866A|nr:hypothetical protein [Rhodococcus sp. 05-2255-1e]